MIGWKEYLDSVCQSYAQWWRVYTFTDVVDQRQPKWEPDIPLLDLGLIVQSIQIEQGESKKPEYSVKESTTAEQLNVLEGLRRYAPEHVLLTGRPGAGKSTALVRLLLEEAERARSALQESVEQSSFEGLDFEVGQANVSFALHGESLKRTPLGIPVLIELRYFQSSVLDIIRIFFQRHCLQLSNQEIEKLLNEKCLFLLIDGLNELPSEAARRELKLFRQIHRALPMVFTTRDAGISGVLGIVKKLEMQPLTETQMQQFISRYLLQDGEKMLHQLGGRLREFGQTPLLLWMLCSLFRAKGKIPDNLGMVFRQFTHSYERQLRQDVSVSDESRRWWSRLLQYLAFEMTQGDSLTDLKVAISQQSAENILTIFLQAENFDRPRDRAISWLQDLLNHHLIHLGNDGQVEFRHQLIQEYYTAQFLLQQIPHLSDELLKHKYLNYLKWTEPLRLTLELETRKTEVLRLVRLALEVDLLLGARLAGAASLEFQPETIQLVVDLEIPKELKLELLGLTHSRYSVPLLAKIMNSGNQKLKYAAVHALRENADKTAVSELNLVLRRGEEYDFTMQVIRELEEIGNESTLYLLFNIIAKFNDHHSLDPLREQNYSIAISEPHEFFNHQVFQICRRSARSLGKICIRLGNEKSISSLSEISKNRDPFIRRIAIESLGKVYIFLKNREIISVILDGLSDENPYVRIEAAKVLAGIRENKEQSTLQLIEILENCEFEEAWTVAIESLFEIVDEINYSVLLEALKSENFKVRIKAAEFLMNIDAKLSIQTLLNALEHEEFNIRLSASDLLIENKSNLSVSALSKFIFHTNPDVRKTAVYILSKINSKPAIDLLTQALNDADDNVRFQVAKALLDNEQENLSEVLEVLANSQNNENRIQAAESLGRKGSEAGFLYLLQALRVEDYTFRAVAAYVLGEIRNPTAVPALLQALTDEDSTVRQAAASALRKIGNEHALVGLLQVIKEQKYYEKNESDKQFRVIRMDVAEDVGSQSKGEAKYLLDVIKAIQEKANIYNYGLIQPSSENSKQFTTTQEVPLVWFSPTCPVYILHLSDLHFSNSNQAKLWANQLASDLYSDLQIPHLNLLILSGDIGNYSTASEYSAAHEFLLEFQEDFSLAAEQIIVVPGNHDINWKVTNWEMSEEPEEAAYKLKFIKQCKPQELLEGYCIKESDNAVWIRDEEKYKHRFANFSTFYQNIKGKPYPLEYDRQYTLDYLSDYNLLILGLNSAWQIDHHYKNRATINMVAFSNALSDIRRNPNYRNALKFAVWHHPLNSPWDDRIKDHSFLQLLAVEGFRFFLHGHIHKAETDLFRYDVSQDGRKLHRICAGTFGAPTRELIPGYPWQYNLLKLEGNQLTVYTRRREEENGAWKPDARWGQGPGRSSLDYYTIEI